MTLIINKKCTLINVQGVVNGYPIRAWKEISFR